MIKWFLPLLLGYGCLAYSDDKALTPYHPSPRDIVVKAQQFCAAAALTCKAMHCSVLGKGQVALLADSAREFLQISDNLDGELAALLTVRSKDEIFQGQITRISSLLKILRSEYRDTRSAMRGEASGDAIGSVLDLLLPPGQPNVVVISLKTRLASLATAIKKLEFELGSIREARERAATDKDDPRILLEDVRRVTFDLRTAVANIQGLEDFHLFPTRDFSSFAEASTFFDATGEVLYTMTNYGIHPTLSFRLQGAGPGETIDVAIKVFNFQEGELTFSTQAPGGLKGNSHPLKLLKRNGFFKSTKLPSSANNMVFRVSLDPEMESWHVFFDDISTEIVATNCRLTIPESAG